MKIFVLMILEVNFRFIFFKKFLVYLLLICFSSCDTFIKEEITGSVYGTTYKKLTVSTVKTFLADSKKSNFKI